MRPDAMIIVSWGRHKEGRMFFAMRTIEHTMGPYEVQDVQYGKVYRWHPESVMVECEQCGQRSTHTRSSREVR